MRNSWRRAIRKWLRGQSEPAVSDLRAICEVTQTNVEWLVMGRGDPAGIVRQSGGKGNIAGAKVLGKPVEYQGLSLTVAENWDEIDCTVAD